jgi:hypothetical protein
MFFHARIFFHSLIFLGILEFISLDFVSSNLAFLSARNFFLASLGFLVLIFYFYQVAKKVSGSFSLTPIPVFFAAGSLGLLYFIQAHWEQNCFIVICAFVYYFIHLALYRLHLYRKDKTALGILSAGNTATIFLIYAVTYGIYLNFAISLWFLMTVILLCTTLISFQYFLLVGENKMLMLSYALILGFIMAEIFWVLSFWPFGYLTTGVAGLIFYFVFWDIIQCHFSQKLSKRRIVFNLVFLSILVTVVLSSARWLPVV